MCLRICISTEHRRASFQGWGAHSPTETCQCTSSGCQAPGIQRGRRQMGSCLQHALRLGGCEQSLQLGECRAWWEQGGRPHPSRGRGQTRGLSQRGVGAGRKGMGLSLRSCVSEGWKRDKGVPIPPQLCPQTVRSWPHAAMNPGQVEQAMAHSCEGTSLCTLQSIGGK